MKEKYVLFWRETDGSSYNWCSQWYKYNMGVCISSNVESLPYLQRWLDLGEADEIIFNCCEQWMMFNKALLFNDVACAKKILLASSPRTQKKLGRSVLNFTETEWQKWNEIVIFIGNIHKFSSVEMGELMLSVPCSKKFVEASPYDKIYGIGLREDNPLAWDEATWKGKNLLGKALDLVRDKIHGK
jgi:ribA/ribD-fused uncharacterized protein